MHYTSLSHCLLINAGGASQLSMVMIVSSMGSLLLIQFTQRESTVCFIGNPTCCMQYTLTSHLAYNNCIHCYSLDLLSYKRFPNHIILSIFESLFEGEVANIAYKLNINIIIINHKNPSFLFVKSGFISLVYSKSVKSKYSTLIKLSYKFIISPYTCGDIS